MNEHAKEIEVLVDVAVLGKQVDDFIQSDVGQFLRRKIDSELEEAIVELKTVDPYNPEQIILAQNKVHRSESMAEWLTQSIMAGLRATEVLESRQDD